MRVASQGKSDDRNRRYRPGGRIGAGKSVVDLWQSAGGIIAAAEKTGKVDADATLLSAGQRSAGVVEAVSGDR
jgi:hypothetical protein